MPTIIDSLLVTLGLDTKQFQKGAADASKAAEQLKQKTVSSAQATETVVKRGAKLSDTEFKERTRRARVYEAEQKRNDELKKRRAETDKKYTDQTINGLKSVARTAAVAVLGFEGIKGAISAYADTTNQLASLGRLAPTVGVNAQQLNSLGNLYKQFGGKQEDASNDIAKIAHGQFSYAMGAPDAFATWARKQGISLFDKQGKNLNPTKVLDEVRDALRRATPDIQAQAMYAREMGLSEAFINTELLTSNEQRAEATKQAEATAAATERNVKSAQTLSTAWGRVSNAISGAKQRFVGNTAGVAAASLGMAAKEFQKGGIGNDLAGGLDVVGAGMFAVLKQLGLPYYDEHNQLVGGSLIGRLTGSGKDRSTFAQRSQFGATELKYGLPRGVLSGIARTESNFNPGAKNDRTGARGLMQLMPEYFKGAGQSQSADIDTAGRLMQRLLKKYGNLQLALAAYNDGEGNVDRRIRSGQALPTETRNYVPKVMSGMAGAAGAAGFSSAASAPRGPAGSAAAGGAPIASTGGTNVEIDQINIITQSTDAAGIAATIPDALRRKGVVAQANSGMS